MVTIAYYNSASRRFRVIIIVEGMLCNHENQCTIYTNYEKYALSLNLVKMFCDMVHSSVKGMWECVKRIDQG